MALHDLTPQLRTRLRRMEKMVGLFVSVAALILLGGFIYYLVHTAERRGWFIPKCPYYTFVQSADGLKVGDPVLLMGFSVGEITVIEAQPPESYYNVFIGFQVKRPYYGYIWTDSVARITPGSLLGGRQLAVTKGRSGVPTVEEKDGDIIGVRAGDQFVSLRDQPLGVMLSPDEAPSLVDRADRLVAKAEEELPKVTAQVQAILDNVEKLTGNLDGLVSEARPVVARLGVIAKNLEDPDGSLGEWLLPSELRGRIDTTLAAVDANLTVLSGTLHNVDAIATSVRGQLGRNDDLLGEVSDLVRSTDDLVRGLRRHWLLRSAFPPPGSGGQAPLSPLPGLPADAAP